MISGRVETARRVARKSDTSTDSWLIVATEIGNRRYQTEESA